MNKAQESIDYRSSLQRAILKLNEMQVKLDASEKAKNEPIAITGMACRFPGGVNTPDAFWQLLQEGRDTITEIPRERWNIDDYYHPDPDAPGKMSTRWGGFLANVDKFDADFFGISPREAASMDPQQRLLLETTWEALEAAGEVLDQLAGTQTGVFVGIYGNDYSLLQLHPSTAIGTYTGTGTSHNIAAGRLSYLLDLRGPSVAIDTACSSSLVAVHQACQSLRNQECHLALAAGVNLLLSPHFLITTSKMHMLSPDGHCKTFDAAANGIVLSEGCGVVVLKRLSDALAAGDPILAVIRGSAVNQDGRSASLTAPNPLAQRDVIRQALANAKLTPRDIGYVEMHGTGTSLGDPIEFEALSAVLGNAQKPGPCYLSSVKTNIGHMGAAAGIAGLIKVVQVLRHKEIPAHLHLHTLNPGIKLADTPFLVPTESVHWEESPACYAGVSSFGWSGTNAHVILQEAPPTETGQDQLPASPEMALFLPLSARSPAALLELARTYVPFLQQLPERGITLADLCYTASVRRSHHAHRLAVVGHSPDELASSLLAFTQTPILADPPVALERTSGVVFVFSGQGSLWPGVARRLLEQEPVFADALRRCDQLLQPLTGWSLLTLLTSCEPELASRLEQTEIAQPVLFCLQMGLATLWQEWGIVPAAVIGHSVGEIAAAVVAQILTLETGIQLVVRRGQLMQATHGQGRMLAVDLSPQEVPDVLASLQVQTQVSIAAFNSARSLVLAGSAAALQRVADLLKQHERFARWLPVAYAFHTRLMDPLQSQLIELAGDLHPQRGRLTLFSTLTGEPLSGEQLDAGYWSRQMREPVQFGSAVQAALQQGYRCFLELSGHPSLGVAIEQSLQERDLVGQVLSSLRKPRDTQNEPPDERALLLQSLAALYASGHEPAWSQLRLWSTQPRPQVVSLPGYRWQGQRYWVESAATAAPLAASQSWRDWLYELHWVPRPLQSEATVASRRPERWLILADQQGVGALLAQRWQAQGVPCALVDLPMNPQADLEPRDWHAWWQQTWQEDPLRQTLQLDDPSHPLLGIVSLDSLDLASGPAQAPQAVSQALWDTWQGAYQCLHVGTQRDPHTPMRLWIVSQAAQALASAQSVALSAIGPAALWGLGRVLALEHPEGWGGLCDLDPQASRARAAEQLWTELSSGSYEDQVGWRAEQRFVARVQPLQIEAAPPSPGSLLAQGSYLVIGGVGGLGLWMARWLVERGARHLVLVSRAGMAAVTAGSETQQVLESWNRQGVQVQIVASDVGEQDDLVALMQRFGTQWLPLRGIVHAAGVSQPQALVSVTASMWQEVTRAKLVGSAVLEYLSHEQPIDFYLYCSSAAAIWGLREQGVYAAANAFLDQFAWQQQQHSPQMRVLSVNWGPWQTAGMATEEIQQHLRQTGMLPLPAREALAALDALLGATGSARRAQGMITQVQWERFGASYEARGRRMLLDDMRHLMVSEQPGGAMVQAREIAQLTHALQGVAPQERQRLLEEAISRVVRQVSGREAEQRIDRQQGFFEMGMDSLMAVELQKQLQEQLGQRLPPTLAFDHPTVERLAQFLLHEVAGWQTVPSTSSSSATSEDTQKALLLNEIEQISEEDAEALVNKELENMLKRI